MSLAYRVQTAIGKLPDSVTLVAGGAAGLVSRIDFADGTALIAKQPEGGGIGLEVEARSLRYLAEHSQLPVPRVLFAEPALLLMQHMPGRPGADAHAQDHVAELLADLHSRTNPEGRYGLHFDGAIGPLPQSNAWCGSWPEFFRTRRLSDMAQAATREGRLPASMERRLNALGARLAELLPERPFASLIHGDVWNGNVLCERGRVTAFLDPAPQYAHAEVELAFIDLFSTFGTRFHDHYRALRGLSAPERREFERVRRDVYNCYPLLVHTRIFGGHYVGELSASLDRLGF